MEFDSNVPQNDDLNLNLEDVEPFPSVYRPLENQEETAAIPSTEHPLSPELSSPHPSRHEVSSASSSADAQQRKRRPPKTLAPDATLQISKHELSSWQSDYLVNMAKANERRLALKAAHLAKRNANWFTFAGGINDIGFDAKRMLNGHHPLAMFSGQNLYNLLAGAGTLPSPPSSRKRSRETDEDEGSSQRRRRTRTRDSEPIRGVDDDLPPIFSDSGLAETGVVDYTEREAEQGRVAPTPAPGQGSSADGDSSAMPWNISAARAESQRAASRGTLSSAQPTRLSQQQQYMVFERSASVTNRRITSASPLNGRGVAGSRQESLGLDLPPGVSSSIAGDDGADLRPIGDVGGLDQDTQIDLFGPAAFVDTQTAGQSQFIRSVLDTESRNFLGYLREAIAERGVDVDRAGFRNSPVDEEEMRDSDEQPGVTFEEILPASQNSHVVAAQGLFHALTLATKGLAWVRQSSWISDNDRGGRWAFGEDIWIGMESDVGGDGSQASPQTHVSSRHSQHNGEQEEMIEEGEEQRGQAEEHEQYAAEPASGD